MTPSERENIRKKSNLELRERLNGYTDKETALYIAREAVKRLLIIEEDQKNVK